MIKLWTILKSRFTKNKNEYWIEVRRKICKDCKIYNSLYYEDSLSVKNKIYKILSDFYTKITFSENEELGQCLHKDCGCNIWYKTNTPTEFCHENKWKSVVNTKYKDKYE